MATIFLIYILDICSQRFVFYAVQTGYVSIFSSVHRHIFGRLVLNSTGYRDRPMAAELLYGTAADRPPHGHQKLRMIPSFQNATSLHHHGTKLLGSVPLLQTAGAFTAVALDL